MKILPLGAELFHEHEQTDRQRHGEANSRISQFCESAKRNVKSPKDGDR